MGSLEYVEKLKQLADKQGTKVFVFIIPEQFSVGNYPDRCQFIQRLCQELRDRHYLQDAVSNWLTSRHIEVIDPTARFIAEENRGNRLYFRWDSHWNVNGHRAAARVIADHLKASPQAIAGF